MRKITVSLLITVLFLGLSSCNDDILNKEQQHLITTKSPNQYAVDSIYAITLAEKIDIFINPKKRKSERIVDKCIKRLTSTGNDLLYMISYKGGGWAIIAADRRIEPILAYSESGKLEIENTHTPFTGWINGLDQKLVEIQTKRKQVDLETKLKWNNTDCPIKPERRCTPSVDDIKTYTYGPFLKSKWGQKNGYNASLDNPSHPAGCTPVAMAQIMRYWKHPQGYNWEAMQYNYPTKVTADFIAELGSRLETEYASDGSDTKRSNIDKVFEKMGYTINYTNFNHATLVNNAKYHPVWLSGSNQEGEGHSWICDGYTTTNFVTYSTASIHMNWGWGGSNNGWFSTNSFYLYVDANNITHKFKIEKIGVNLKPIR